MKRLYIITALVFIFAVAIAAQEHLKFKGIEMTGSLSEFCSKLEQNGFEYSDSQLDKKNTRIMEGNFTDRMVSAFITATSDCRQVVDVGVFMPDTESWQTLKAMFDEYKDLYTTKYGEPSVLSEKFLNDIYDRPGWEMLGVVRDLCDYRAVYLAPGGVMTITIVKQKYNSGTVMILYQDGFNSLIRSMQKLDDI